MLVVDPSSQCDVCLQSFSERRECCCIPCGHVFCYRCLERLQHKICPMCRDPFSMSRIRKIHLDMSGSSNRHPQDHSTGDRSQPSKARRDIQILEKTLYPEEQLSQGLSLRRARDMRKKLKAFLKDQPIDQHPLLRSIKELLKQYILRMEESHEEFSNARAVQASYEDRIGQLEQLLNAQKQKIRTLRRAKNENPTKGPADQRIIARWHLDLT